MVYYDYDLSGWFLVGEPDPTSDPEPSFEPAQTETETVETETETEPVPGNEHIELIVDTTSLIEARLEQIEVACFGCLILLAASVLLAVFSRLWGSI